MKSCCNKECKQRNPQPLEAFNKDKHSKDGFRARCRICIREYKKETYQMDPERQYIYNLKYITTYPERRAYTQRRYNAKKASNE